MTDKANVNRAEKLAVARYLVDRIPDGASIILDAGTSVAAVAELLAKRTGLTIFINSAPSLQHLIGSDNELFMLGGRIRPSSWSTVGEWVTTELAGIHADYAILGVDSVSLADGPTVSAQNEVPVKCAMIAASTTSIAAADSSKFKRTGGFHICDWGQLDLLVTDKRLDDPAFKQTAKLVRIECAEQ